MKEKIIFTIEKEVVRGTSENRIIDIGDRLKIFDETAINFLYHSGDVGQKSELRKKIPNKMVSDDHELNRKVFVVHGHDTKSLGELEAMLRRWHLEPMILNQLPSRGQTIIEKLEELINKVRFAIVLATPDDMGFAKGQEDKIKYRVRQNVLFEMGWLSAYLGRDRVVILLNTCEDIERP